MFSLGASARGAEDRRLNADDQMVLPPVPLFKGSAVNRQMRLMGVRGDGAVWVADPACTSAARRDQPLSSKDGIGCALDVRFAAGTGAGVRAGSNR